VSRIRADGVDHDKHTIGLWRQRLSLSRQAVPSLNQRSRVGPEALRARYAKSARSGC
jgi:hypothetical protein